jgi:hypothetical protein
MVLCEKKTAIKCLGRRRAGREKEKKLALICCKKWRLVTFIAADESF